MGAGASDYFAYNADVQYGFLDAELGVFNLHKMAAQGRFRDVSVQLKHGLNPNAARDDPEDDKFEREDTPLICAARGYRWNKGQQRHVRTLEVLHAFGADVNKCNRLEQTALYVACDRDLPLVVEWLLEHGADPNKASKARDSPLMCAYRNQNAAIVSLLLARGARAEKPPSQFSCIKFPSLMEAAAVDGASSAERPKTVSLPTPSDSLCNSATPASRPESRRRWFRPDEPNPSPQVVSATQRTTIQSSILNALDRETQARDKLVKAAEEAQRLDDQRVYRAQLADDNRKRRDRRRAQRETAIRQKYVAELEQKTQRIVPSATGPPIQRPATRSGAEQRDEILAWERTVVAGSRPQWVAHPVWSLSQTVSGAKQMADCQTLFDSLEKERARRERVQAVPCYAVRPDTAPA